MNQGIIVKKSKIDKKGVFAARNFRKGEIVLKWNPEILKKSEVDNLSDKLKHYVYGGKVGKGRYFFMQPPERYINHSCEANTKTKNFCDVATRDIKKGEEITSDYEKDGSMSFNCNCGNKNCRQKNKI